MTYIETLAVAAAILKAGDVAQFGAALGGHLASPTSTGEDCPMYSDYVGEPEGYVAQAMELITEAELLLAKQAQTDV